MGTGSQPDALRDAARFFDDLATLMEAGDPRIPKIGTPADVRRIIEERSADVGSSVWNMQHVASLPILRTSQSLDRENLQRGVEHRDVLPRSILRTCPLAPTFVPWLRVGTVPAPMLVIDGEYVLVAGPAGTAEARSMWETTDPALVDRATAVYRALWERARPWQELTDRPVLPPRTLEVAVRLADGASDREIADELGIGMRTAAAEVRRVVDWCGARSRHHATAVLVGADA